MHGQPDTTVQTAARGAPVVIVLLMLTNTLNHLDRHIVSILAEPIKNEFGLADWQIGVLTGLSFAVFYGLSSLLIGHLADRTNRARVITLCLAAWSVFTALSAFVQSYLQLILLRILVGVAEGGGSAPSQSLITDITPKHRRAQALAAFTVGIPLGSFLGMLIGGVFLDLHGWRAGFMVAGLPGIALALVLLLVLRDPARRAAIADAPAKKPTVDFVRSLAGASKAIWTDRPFLFITLGGIFITFVNYGQSAFLASHFFRTFGSDLDRIGAELFSAIGLAFGAGAALGGALGLAKGLPGVVGTLWGGWMTDKLWARTPAWLGLLPALTAWARIPVIVLMLLTDNLYAALGLVVIQAFIMGLAAPAGYAAVQALAASGTRALAAASYMFMLNVAGLGLGPLLLGLLSDGLQDAGASAAEGLRNALLICAVIGLSIGGALKWAAQEPLRRRLNT